MNSASSLKSLVSSLRINLASKMTSSSSPIQLIDITIKVTTYTDPKPAAHKALSFSPQLLKNFHGKVHRVKNVFHLTQVPFFHALVTKISNGDTDVAVNSLELVIPRENS